MRGLLYKEIAGLLGLYKKNLLLIAVIYAVLTVTTEMDTFAAIGIWMMMFYSLSGFSLDDHSGWNRYVRTLPVTDRQVVAAKFLATMAFMGIGVAYALAVGVIRWLVSGRFFSWTEYLLEMGLITIVALIFTALVMLLAVKFGIEKARNYFLVTWGAIFAVGFLASRMGGDGTQMMAASHWIENHVLLTVVGGFAVAAVVMAVCYAASCAIYSRKEF